MYTSLVSWGQSFLIGTGALKLDYLPSEKCGARGWGDYDRT